MIRRLLYVAGFLVVLGFGILFLSYEIVGVDFSDVMENQPVVRAQEGPRLSAPADAVPLSRPAYAEESGLPVNPVPADEVSLQRGTLLFGFNCAVCHGDGGQGDGPVTQRFKPEARFPANLTEARIAQFPDGYIYNVTSHGQGAMPPLRENLDERQRWDVINYVRTLSP